MRVVHLREYATETDVELSAHQRDALRELVPSLRLSPSPGSTGQFDCTPGSVIGVVTLDDLQIIIQPKLPIDNVLFLISYSLDPSAWWDTPSPLSTTDDLVEALVPPFLHHLRSALGQGLLRGYVPTDDALDVVRGRIRFGDQIAQRFGRVPPIEVSYDEFTEDIVENQVLAAATDHLLRLRLRNERLRDDLRVARREFVGITRLLDLRTIDDIQWSRLNSRYRPAVNLASVILRGLGLDLKKGRSPGTAFLVDMNKVFESFVHIALQEALGLDERTFPRGCSRRPLYLDERDRVRLRPDLSWWHGQHCVFVGDVKYKRTDSGDGKHPDLYQLLAYATASGLEEGLLIYAAGESEPTTHEVRLAGKRLRVVTLDLAGRPQELLATLGDVADYIAASARHSGQPAGATLHA